MMTGPCRGVPRRAMLLSGLFWTPDRWHLDTYITRLFESGLDIKEIQYLAGHTTVEMTLRVYTHYQKESRKSETARRVTEALG